MSFDYRQLEGFAENFEKISVGFTPFLNRFLTKVALDALARTKRRTPVGETGDLRRSWSLSDVKREGNNLVIYLINDMEYASYVENGHLTRNRENWVDGFFMATISIEDADRLMPSRFDREFKKYLMSLGVG